MISLLIIGYWNKQNNFRTISHASDIKAEWWRQKEVEFWGISTSNCIIECLCVRNFKKVSCLAIIRDVTWSLFFPPILIPELSVFVDTFHLCDTKQQGYHIVFHSRFITYHYYHYYTVIIIIKTLTIKFWLKKHVLWSQC